MFTIPTCHGYSLTSVSEPPTIFWSLTARPQKQSSVFTTSSAEGDNVLLDDIDGGDVLDIEDEEDVEEDKFWIKILAKLVESKQCINDIYFLVFEHLKMLRNL